MGKLARILGIEEAADRGALATAEFQAEKLQESLAQMELALEDRGWEKLLGNSTQDFTRDGLKRAAQLSRMMAIANPLIKRGLAVRAAYVHGQGVGITARAVGNEGEQDVNAVVQEFLDDDANRAVLTGQQAKRRLEMALGTDGNVFITMFTNPLTGKVSPRTLPFDEISDVVTKPGDRATPMFYRRDWTEGTKQFTAFYPDLRWRPAQRAKRFAVTETESYDILWDSPVYHLHDNGLEGWKFGIGDAYAALPWARAYKEFLEDWTLLIKALSRIAFQLQKSKTPVSQKQRAALQSMPAGSTLATTGDTAVEAVPKTGATIDSESGRPVAAMVAAALGVPVTILMSDPGQTGARAVAETLNQPTVLEYKGRQELWTEALRALLGYVIDQAVMAPRGPLKGTVVRERESLSVTLAGNTDRTLEFEWPDLNEMPVETIVKAVTEADATGKVPPLVTLRLLLRALGVRDVDEILEDCTDDRGNWIDPGVSAGDVATRAYRRGQTPEEAAR